MMRGSKIRDTGEVVRRLLAVKMMIVGMKDAMPTAARDLRREASETLDEIIQEIGVQA